MRSLMSKFKKGLTGAILGCLGWVLQTGPKGASSVISEWALWLGIENVPSWLRTRTADTVAFWIVIVGLIVWFAFLLWQRRSRRITWDFSHFIGSGVHGETRPLIYGFQATATNNTGHSLDGVSGFVRSLVTGEQFEMFLNVDGVPTRAENTHGIPAGAKFTIVVPFHHAPHPPPESAYMSLDTFEAEMGEFQFVFIHDGKTFKKTFRRKDTKTVGETLRNIMIGDTQPRVRRK
jgi:hypothetical protein